MPSTAFAPYTDRTGCGIGQTLAAASTARVTRMGDSDQYAGSLRQLLAQLS